MLSHQPLWTEDFPRPDSLEGGLLPARTDVAIVGSGVTGLNAARRLMRAGATVAVLDRGPIASGASSVNGGMVIYGLKAATQDVFRRYGPERGAEFWRAALHSIDRVEEVVKEEGIDCSFARYGSAELAFTPRDTAHLVGDAAWHEEHVGFTPDLVTRDRLRAEVVDSPAFDSALIEPVSGGLHPARYVFGLAEALQRKGVVLVAGAEVRRIERDGGRYRVATSRGDTSAGQVLVATNGYTGPLVPGLRRRIVPVGSYIAVTEPLGAATAERLIPAGRMLWTSRRLLNYFRRTPDDRLLMGGRQNLSTRLDLDESARVLRRTIERFFPDLTGVAVTHSWTGTLGVTFDLMPHIGRVGGIWYAVGYSGHGVGIGTYLGDEVGRLMTGELARSPFAEIDHPGRWYYRGRPWFLPAAARLYRTLDRLGR